MFRKESSLPRIARPVKPSRVCGPARPGGAENASSLPQAPHAPSCIMERRAHAFYV